MLNCVSLLVFGLGIVVRPAWTLAEIEADDGEDIIPTYLFTFSTFIKIVTKIRAGFGGTTGTAVGIA